MWASGGTAHVNLLTAQVNLTGWGSNATVAHVSNSAFYPAVAQSCYAPTRDSYLPTVVNVDTNGDIAVGYAGGPTGNRVASHILTYNID